MTAELERQFQLAKDKGWMPGFLGEDNYGISPHILMGIASRETSMQNIIGDHGHGHGLMQIDDRSFPAWCRSGKWKVAIEGIRMGAFVLRSKYNYAHANGVPTGAVLKVAIASYNVGPYAVEDYRTHLNPDMHTTGGNYSHDVLERAQVFKKLLTAWQGSD